MINEKSLREAGWRITTGPGPGRMLNLVTQIPHWDRMSWAERTFQQARYGFDRQGILFIADHTLRVPQVQQSILNAIRREENGRSHMMPGGTMPGAQDRLRKLLQHHREYEYAVNREKVVAWSGPDGSILLTRPEGWGLPGQTPALLSLEPGREDLICEWDTDGEQPDWSLPEEDEVRRQPRPDGHWSIESTQEYHGVREVNFRDNRYALGDPMRKTTDGQHVLEWRRKHTKNSMTLTAHPRTPDCREPWEIRITSRGNSGMVTVNSKRGGMSERVGSVGDFSLAIVIAHKHAAREMRVMARRADEKEADGKEAAGKEAEAEE